MKKISILGSTGSIGKQALDVIKKNANMFEIVGLTTNNNIHLLFQQIIEFRPKFVTVMDESKATELKNLLKLHNIKVDVFSGMEGLINIAKSQENQLVLNALVGIIGLIPTIEAIKAKKDIALANKEVLVTAGEIIMKEVKNMGVKLIPVDSEHSAIFQCIERIDDKNIIAKLILTASGGPFRGKKLSELKDVSPELVIRHPKWRMGKKISVDSATLMNKGLEVIEARWLFDIDIDRIEVVIHPECIIHSLVEFIDGSYLAQLSYTDMKVPIQYALTYPKRVKSSINRLDLAQIGKLTFEKPDFKEFPCFGLAIKSIQIGGSMPIVLNSANEEAVNLFLNNVIKFIDIPYIVERVMEKHDVKYNIDIKDILYFDKWARNEVYTVIKQRGE